MSEVHYETCSCGAEIRYVGNYAVLALSNFRKAHEACRQAKGVKTCEPSPGVTVTHGG